MYMRSYRLDGANRADRIYTPPPGYVGHAFPPENDLPEPEMKHHAPQEEFPGTTSCVVPDVPAEETLDFRSPETSRTFLPLTSLLDSLRGKIGTEEWLLLLVMLLTAADGVGVEVLLLALVLLAG